MPVNTSKVRPPTWTGASGEMAVLVSRGEPNRSDLQMEQAVAEQVQMYLVHHASWVGANPVLIALSVQLIAEDYITDQLGTRKVALTREHLLAYVQVAKAKLTEAGSGE